MGTMKRSQTDLLCDWHAFSVPAESEDQSFFLRPFGVLAEDLDVDFSRKPPYVAADILHCCARGQQGARVDPDFCWDLPVGIRIQCLLILCRLDQGDAFPVHFTCASSGCGKLMELDLSLNQLIALQQATAPNYQIAINHNDQKQQMRRPTGRDQRQWLQNVYADKTLAAHAMIQILWIAGKTASKPIPESISPEMLANISRTLDAADPLINYQSSTICPYCSHHADYPIDLEALALKQMHQAQNHLLHDVHRLASTYHWSETDIFAVPPWRRALYLKRIEMEGP